MTQLDYASILSAGQGLVPNLREQMFQQQEMQARTQELDMRAQAFKAKQDEAVNASQRRAAFEADLDAFMAHPSPQGAAQMMLRHPEFADQFKAGWGALDEQQKRTDLTQMGEIYYRANQGDYAGAAEKLRVRIDADEAAGQDVETDKMMLADLQSGNPVKQKAAAGLIAFHTRAGDPEAFDKLFPQDKADPTELERKYRFLIQTRGLGYAEQWLSEQTQEIVSLEPGATPYRKSDIIGGSGFSGQPKGGDPASIGGRGIGGSPGPTVPPIGNAKEVVQSLFPAAKVTDWKRPADSRLGKANPKSWHVNSGAAVDVRPIPGMTFGEFVGSIKAAGHNIIEARDEATNPSKHATGKHWHVVIGQGGPGAKPVIVRTVQQARKLPPGTVFKTPDGRTMKVPG